MNERKRQVNERHRTTHCVLIEDEVNIENPLKFFGQTENKWKQDRCGEIESKRS